MPMAASGLRCDEMIVGLLLAIVSSYARLTRSHRMKSCSMALGTLTMFLVGYAICFVVGNSVLRKALLLWA